MARKGITFTDADWGMMGSCGKGDAAKAKEGIPDFIKATQEEEKRNVPLPVRSREESMALPQTDQHLKAMRRLGEGLKDRNVPRDDYGQIIVSCSCKFEQICPICDDRQGAWVSRNDNGQNSNQNNRNENYQNSNQNNQRLGRNGNK